MAYTTHGRAYNFYDPSNAQTMNAALVAIIYGQLITPPTDVQPFVSIPVPMPPKTAQVLLSLPASMMALQGIDDSGSDPLEGGNLLSACVAACRPPRLTTTPTCPSGTPAGRGRSRATS